MKRFLLFFFVFGILGCDNFSLFRELGLEQIEGTLSLEPKTAYVSVGKNLTFTATGGTPPYEYSVSGSGIIDIDTGFYTAPAVPGTDMVTVADVDGFIRTVTVNVINPAVNPLTIFPSSLTISTNEVFFFGAVGGIPPYNYTITAGGGSVDAVTGKFTAPGSPGSTTVTVTDSDAPPVTDTAAVTTVEGLVIIPQTVSVPANNNVAFSAGGGTPPYTFTFGPDEDADVDGAITAGGFYTAPAAEGTDKVRVTDNAGNSRIATITVTPPQPLNISPSSYIILTDGLLTFTAFGGKPPYSFAKVSGNGSVTPGGDYTAPDVPGIDVIRVIDSSDPPNLPVDAIVRVVEIGPLLIEPDAVVVEQGKSFKFYSSGGAPQYSYSVMTVGGGSILSNGEYSAPLMIPAGPVTIRVTDSALDWVEATVDVAPAAPENLAVDGTVPGPQDILISWDDSSTGEDGFSVERKLSGGVYSEVKVVGPGVESWTDSGLDPNIPYAYRVRAFKGMVYSGYSNEDFDIPNS